ncbi:GMP synthase [Labrys miyagiensis]|uniref:GMP synthase n=1 Tax=Labrys miyagiensis TaxID=346912 RepID=A0ABQ6C9P4_9HYPH|nr:type 1 glutamine amidotransferase [Labrys miyagiensis]GLS17102.1 GMP synthase [Labrys miyagiensis]
MRLLVFQHLTAGHPGIFRSFFARDGVIWDAIRLDRGEAIPSLDAYDALWVMGGEMNVWDVDEHSWLVEEKQTIRRWVRELQRPFLGFCLGHQLLTDALGGTCGPMRQSDVGLRDMEATPAGREDPLFSGLSPCFKALEWHAVRVAQPPEGAQVLASSAGCSVEAIQAAPRAWGLQFHAEADDQSVRDWSTHGDYQASFERRHGEGAMARLETEMVSRAGELEGNAVLLYRNFMRAVQG